MKTLYILVLFALFAAGKSQPVELQPFYNYLNSSVFHVDNYLNAHRLQYWKNIWLYNNRIENFKTLYNERINTLLIQQKLLIESIVQSFEYLRPMELLSELNERCIKKYNNIIPPISAIKYNTDYCINVGLNQLNSLIANPSSTNRTLQSYYTNTFEKAVQACQKSHPSSELNYTLCAQNAVTAADVYTLNNQKTFDIQMDSTESTAQVHIKRAMECFFKENNSTISSNSQGRTLIDRCIRGMDHCNSSTGNYCDKVIYVPASSIDYRNETMPNVFYGSNPNDKCALLSVF